MTLPKNIILGVCGIKKKTILTTSTENYGGGLGPLEKKSGCLFFLFFFQNSEGKKLNSDWLTVTEMINCQSFTSTIVN